MSGEIKPDGFHGLHGLYVNGRQESGPFIYCDDPAHVVQKLIEAGVLEVSRWLCEGHNGLVHHSFTTFHGHVAENCGEQSYDVTPLYRIRLPNEEQTDD